MTLERIAGSSWFQNTVLVVILIAGILAGVGTSPELVASMGSALTIVDRVILAIFVIELVVKLGAVSWNPQRFFSDTWNVFDTAIVAFAFIPFDGNSVTVLRLARLLRFLRLLRAIPRLTILVGALFKSVPSMGYVGLLLGILVYAYGIIGVGLFGANDPFHFGTLPSAMLTLFSSATGEAWVDVMYTNMYGCKAYGYDSMPQLCTQSAANPVVGALYFCSFMMFGAMVALNLLIGIIMNGMEETARENAQLDAVERGDVQTIEGELAALEEQLEAMRARMDTIRELASQGSNGKQADS